MQIVKEVPIAKIKTGARFQQPDSDEIEKLAESIERDGLLEPVGLNEDLTLIYGLTRIEACKLLGWETIPAMVWDVGEVEAKRKEITENIVRRKMTELEEGLALAELQKLHEAEAKRGGDRKRNSHPTAGFADEIAEKTGTSARTVRRKIATVKAIAPDAVEALPGTMLENNRAELSRLAKIKKPLQAQVVEAVKDGRAETVADAADLLDGKKKPVPEHLRDIFALRPRFISLQKKVAECITDWLDLTASKANHFCQNSVKVDLMNAHHAIAFAAPYQPCWCKGHGCNRCKGAGYVTKSHAKAKR